MTTRQAHRQPRQPLAPPSANVLNTHYAHITTKSANGTVNMESHVRDDVQEGGSVVSDLSELEEDEADADDFDKLILQNARDERRLLEARQGRVQAFRKARVHPRVGLTIDNLGRNNARDDVVTGAHVKFESPPSSSGSARSDPAIHAPPGWGRKGRTNRNWMRTITSEDEAGEEQQQQTPVAGHDTAEDTRDADYPRRSVEDSPLSHKSSIHGTPRNNQSDWDLTFELNEASMIASTPYIPRNTALDDIRQQEIESFKEQRLTSARLDRIQEGSPKQTRRPHSSSAKSTNDTNGATTEPATQGGASPQKRLRTRTNSWQSIGKSQAVTGIGKENSPVAVYTSAESISVVEHHVLNTQNNLPKRMPHRREDSQDLLRRLARASNTPSPARVAALRPQTAPASQLNSSSQTMVSDTSLQPTESKEDADTEGPEPAHITKDIRGRFSQEETKKALPDIESPPESLAGPEAGVEDVDATPMSVEPSLLNPKTPVVTGAWVDTPGPRTARKVFDVSRSPSRSPKKSSLRKSETPQDEPVPSAEEALDGVALDTVRPQLPSSALHALVQEAKANGLRQSADYGDSTINSLEDLITPLPESPKGELEEDTLQGLQLPTGAPRNEAERQRQQELLHLHRMNDRLRAARTSIRDASRGMKRVETQVEHVETEGNEEQARAGYRECPCVMNGPHQFSLWQWSKSFVWQERIKTTREARNTQWKMWGGLTSLGIFAVVFFTWWISEEIACEIYCHPLYANFSPYPFAVNMDAPHYPFVIPTLIYRNLIKVWWLPLYSFLSWVGATTWKVVFGLDDERECVVSQAAHEYIRSTATKRWIASTQIAEDWDLRMTNDERIR